MSLLEACGVVRRFSEGQHQTLALSSVSLCVEPGQFLAVTGPSGSGKSTLLNVLSGLDQPTDGLIRYQGQLLSKMKANAIALLRNQEFGFVFQLPHVLPDRTVFENLVLPLQYAPLSDRAKGEQRCLSLLDYVGLGDMGNRSPNTLSGGELQRLVFARALVNNPSLIFADEPTGSLDLGNSRRLLELLREQVNLGRAVIMVTHDPVAAQFADDELALKKAR